ncbi:DUF4426 domain-containing protein [Halopseudomonas sp.]|uniref:DUF4426 domain-containing protein n=1 Tax=Halopseudomonas sp. TaxID=2901191 RepID=UPI003565399D
MTIKQKYKFQGFALAAMLSTALLAGCDQTEEPEQNADSTENPTNLDLQGQERPLEHVEEFDDYSIQGSITPTERLPDVMIQEYNIEPGPERLIFNAIIYEKRSDGEREPVSADVNVLYENLVGHEIEIDMRQVEANGDVSYIGTVDTSGQLVFRFMIEARPEGSDESLQTEFEVQLPPRDTE